MSGALIATVLGVAVVDAVNPSALAMTSYLVSRPDPWPQVRAYIAGIFVTYLTVGLTIAFALSSIVEVIVDALADRGIGYGLQAVIGVVVIVAAARAWCRRSSKQRARPVVVSPWAAFGLGMAITAVEATTALPYLGALVAITRADPAGIEVVALLVAYNLIFIAPPVAVAVAVRYARHGIVEQVVAPVRRAVRRGAALRLIAQVGALLIGAVLVVDAAVYFVAGQPIFT
jgi:cytochrome c biogenesis protein CcdA